MFDIGDYCYYVDHDRETIERFKVVSFYKNEETRIDNCILVSGSDMMIMDVALLDQHFMSAEEIYKCLCGELA